MIMKYCPDSLVGTYSYTFKDIKTSNNITEYPVWLHIRFNYEILSTNIKHMASRRRGTA